jgi:hypothetical protein
MNNILPAAPSEVPVFLHAADFPTDRVVVEFSQGTGALPTILNLDIALLNGGIDTASVQVPPRATIEQLIDAAISIPRPANIQAFRGSDKFAKCVLFLATGTVFTGLRVHASLAPEHQPSEPGDTAFRGAYWGNDVHASQFVING